MASARKIVSGIFQPAALAAAFFLYSATPALHAQGTVAGKWIGTADYNNQKVPFRLDISGDGDHVQGALVNGVNGKEKSVSTSGSYSDGHLVLHFDYYANAIDAKVKDGVLTGTFAGHSKSIPLTAQLNGTLPASSPHPPRIDGSWEIAVKSPKGESAWELHVKQSGADVNAVIQRIDGDTGNLYGEWRDGQFVVTHFTADGPSYAALRPQPDGTLQVTTFSHGVAQDHAARRPQAARAAGLSGPDDPRTHTTLKDPRRPLAFSANNLSGKPVSSTDKEFKGKVVIVSIGGSWCPNCHDEAPFLEELYRKYHDRGLDIVELSFEEESQLANPVRLRAFIQRYGITYQVLLAGTPEQLNDKLPQAKGLDSWPTTFFIGRDGLVKAIHTGYSGPATGTGNADLRKEENALVLRLLSGNDRAGNEAPALR
jgi:thiol-disulfide isomerase/thioredoxin